MSSTETMHTEVEYCTVCGIPLTEDEVEDCEGMCYEHYNGLASDIEEYSDAPVFHAPFIDDEEVLRMIGGMR